MALPSAPTAGPGPGGVAVRPEAVGICGSDYHFFIGELSPAAGGVAVSTGAGARAGGDDHGARAGLPPGAHGRPAGRGVAAARLRGLLPVQRRPSQHLRQLRLIGIHIDGGLQELLFTGRSGVSDPAENPAVAAIAEPVSIGVRAVNRARIEAGEQAVVMGAGPSASASAWRRGSAARTCWWSTPSPTSRAEHRHGRETLVWTGLPRSLPLLAAGRDPRVPPSRWTRPGRRWR